MHRRISLLEHLVVKYGLRTLRPYANQIVEREKLYITEQKSKNSTKSDLEPSVNKQSIYYYLAIFSSHNNFFHHVYTSV